MSHLLAGWDIVISFDQLIQLYLELLIAGVGSFLQRMSGEAFVISLWFLGTG